MKKKLTLLLALCLVCTGVFAGCGSKEEKAEAPQTIDDIEGEEAEAPAEEAGEAALADAQEMVFVLNNEPDTIDPTITNNSFATPFLINCFEGLVTYDENGEVVPGNAESWE